MIKFDWVSNPQDSKSGHAQHPLASLTDPLLYRSVDKLDHHGWNSSPSRWKSWAVVARIHLDRSCIFHHFHCWEGIHSCHCIRRVEMGWLSNGPGSGISTAKTIEAFLINQQLAGIIAGVLTTISVNLGYGAHMAYLSHQQASEAIRYQYIIEPLSYLALVLGRVSFAVSLIQLIGVTKLRRWMFYGLIIGQVVINLIMIGIQLGQCNPPAKYWNPTVKGKCMSPRVIEYTGYVQGCECAFWFKMKEIFLFFTLAWNVFTDFALALLPAIVISNLDLGFQTKICLVILMSLGIL